jgi:hypothetical protein
MCPRLDIWPSPNERLREVRNRLGKICVATPPTVDRLHLREAEPLSDLGCPDKLIHVNAPPLHYVDPRTRQRQLD